MKNKKNNNNSKTSKPNQPKKLNPFEQLDSDNSFFMEFNKNVDLRGNSFGHTYTTKTVNTFLQINNGNVSVKSATINERDSLVNVSEKINVDNNEIYLMFKNCRIMIKSTYSSSNTTYSIGYDMYSIYDTDDNYRPMIDFVGNISKISCKNKQIDIVLPNTTAFILFTMGFVSNYNNKIVPEIYFFNMFPVQHAYINNLNNISSDIEGYSIYTSISLFDEFECLFEPLIYKDYVLDENRRLKMANSFKWCDTVTFSYKNDKLVENINEYHLKPLRILCYEFSQNTLTKKNLDGYINTALSKLTSEISKISSVLAFIIQSFGIDRHCLFGNFGSFFNLSYNDDKKKIKYLKHIDHFVKVNQDVVSKNSSLEADLEIANKNIEECNKINKFKIDQKLQEINKLNTEIEEFENRIGLLNGENAGLNNELKDFQNKFMNTMLNYSSLKENYDKLNIDIKNDKTNESLINEIEILKQNIDKLQEANMKNLIANSKNSNSNFNSNVKQEEQEVEYFEDQFINKKRFYNSKGNKFNIFNFINGK